MTLSINGIYISIKFKCIVTSTVHAYQLFMSMIKLHTFNIIIHYNNFVYLTIESMTAYFAKWIANLF